MKVSAYLLVSVLVVFAWACDRDGEDAASESSPAGAARSDTHEQAEHSGEHAHSEHAHGHEGEHGEAAAAGVQPTKVLDDGSRLFGSELSNDRELVKLADIAKDPASHVGKTIRTRGKIEQVCQRKGCWMELRDEGLESAMRVTFVDYSFFVPKNVVGKEATLEGTVNVRELSDDDKKHLASEGATAAALAGASLIATGVILH